MMPLGHILHEANASAFFGLGPTQAGLARTKGPRFEQVQQPSDVIAVAAAYRKAKCLKLLIERRQLTHVLRRPSDLESVPVDNGNEVIQSVVRCRHSRLPIRAFSQFAVTEQSEDPIVLAIHLAG